MRMPLCLSLGVGLQPRQGAGEGETRPWVCGPPFSRVSWQRWSLVAGGLNVAWMPVAVTLGSFQWCDLGCALWCQILWFLPVYRARFPRLPIHSVSYLNAFQYIFFFYQESICGVGNQEPCLVQHLSL